jgi:hypothetical protein
MEKEGRNIVTKSLKRHHFVKRKMQGKLACGYFIDREIQFKIITEKLNKFKKSDNPIISIDTKKKELLGQIYRNGKVYCTKALEVYDHTTYIITDGTVIPHGIYDIKQNKAYVNIGTTHETAKFLCDSLRIWWEKQGKKRLS